jgi:hypothetical protein
LCLFAPKPEADLSSKLLTRSAYSTTDEAVQGKETAAHSKADIMNLISMDLYKLKDLLWTLSKSVRITLKMAIGFFYIWTILGECFVLEVKTY